MIDNPEPPRVFANRVIRQMVDHMLSDDMITEPDDLIAIRTAFRANGGSWGRIGEGDVEQYDKLKNIITAWGQMPERKKHSDRIV